MDISTVLPPGTPSAHGARRHHHDGHQSSDLALSRLREGGVKTCELWTDPRSLAFARAVYDRYLRTSHLSEPFHKDSMQHFDKWLTEQTRQARLEAYQAQIALKQPQRKGA
jgi:hypothetical protein